MKERSVVGSALGVAEVIANSALARLAPRQAVRRLVGFLGSSDEDTAMAAYMALVKLGPRIAPHLLAEAHAGRQTASVLQVLGDLGDPEIVPALKEFLNSDDPCVASAARESLQALLEEDVDENA